MAYPPAGTNAGDYDGNRMGLTRGCHKQVLKPGDVIWTPPGIKHWHGATSTTGVTHMAIQETLDGKNVEWLEPVTEA